MQKLGERLPVLAFLMSLSIILIGGSFLYGVVASRRDWPPVPQLGEAYTSVKEVFDPSDAILKTENILHESPMATPLPMALQPGLVLVSGDVAERQTSVRVMDRAGRIIQEWRPVWSEIWPAGEGNFVDRPVEGMNLHGLDLLPDGSIVGNFQHQSSFRLNACGDLLWKLDNLGHHSVHYADDGTIWVASEKIRANVKAATVDSNASANDYILQQIGLDGKILRNISVFDVLKKNDLDGLLYMSKVGPQSPGLLRDTLHLNDVETFPAGVASDIFKAGDLLISLRDVNAVLVIAPNDLKVKFVSVGRFLHQHDPDFIAGDKISVFDNHNVPQSDTSVRASRIVEIDARTGVVKTVLEGTGEEPFFTDVMGSHERLPNGNILVVPSGEGRVLEFTPDGRLAWRFDNRVAKGLNRRVYNAMVLPESMNEAFFKAKRAACGK